MGIAIEGFKELDEQLSKLSRSGGKAAMRRALKTAATPFTEAAQAAAPVGKYDHMPDFESFADSKKDKTDEGDKSEPKKRRKRKGGYLKASIGISTKLNKAQRKLERKEGRDSVKIFVGSSAPHAHLVEFGTVRASPRPFLRPTWEAHKDQVLERLKVEMWKEVLKTIDRSNKMAARKARK